MKTKDFTKITIKDEHFLIQGNTVTCRLTCKLNLKELERQTSCFTESFIHKVLHQQLPYVKIIRKETTGITEYNTDVVAKYYIVPGVYARVIYFDENYFENTRREKNSNYKYHKKLSQKKGDIIRIKEIVNASEALGETSETYYLNTFVVTGKAKCLPTDVFNENIGRDIARNKAMLKAVKKLYSIYSELETYLSENTTDLMLALDSLSEKKFNLINEL